MAKPPARSPRRCLFPRYHTVFGTTFDVGLLLAAPLILRGPGEDGSFLRGAATALAAMAISVLVHNQGTLFVGPAGLAVLNGCWLRLLLRWSDVVSVQVNDLGLVFRTARARSDWTLAIGTGPRWGRHSPANSSLRLRAGCKPPSPLVRWATTA